MELAGKVALVTAQGRGSGRLLPCGSHPKVRQWECSRAAAFQASVAE